jgi:hypothetical protein
MTEIKKSKKPKIEPTKLDPYEYFRARGAQNNPQPEQPDPILNKVFNLAPEPIIPEKEIEKENKKEKELTTLQSSDNEELLSENINLVAKYSPFPKQILFRPKKESPEQTHILSRLNAETSVCLGYTFSESFLCNLMVLIFEKFHDQIPNLIEDLQDLKNTLPEQLELRQAKLVNFYLEKFNQLINKRDY